MMNTPLLPGDAFWDTAVALFGFAMSTSLPLSQAGIASSALLAIAVPLLIHFVGACWVEGYGLFAPFLGGPVHVVLQSLAWTCYGLLLTSLTLQAPDLGGTRGVLAALSQLLLAASLCVHDSRASPGRRVPIWSHGTVACTVAVSIAWVLCLASELDLL
ncbi:unnamed protein product, partial [Phaeothamnion confervicola]